MQTALEALIAAKALLIPTSFWRSGEEGEGIDDLPRYCLQLAISRASINRNKALEILAYVIDPPREKGSILATIWNFNDFHTYEESMAKLDEAIAVAKEQGV